MEKVEVVAFEEIIAFDDILMFPVGIVRLETGVLVYTPILDVNIVENTVCVTLRGVDTSNVDTLPTFVSILEFCKDDAYKDVIFISVLDDILDNMVLLAWSVETITDDVFILLVRMVETTSCVI